MKKTHPQSEKTIESMPKKQKLKKAAPARVAFLLSASLIIVLGCGVAAYAFYVSNRVLPHTYAAGVSIGGLTKEEALAKIRDKEQAFSASDLTLSHEGKTWQLPAKDLGLTFDEGQYIEQAYSRGKQGPISSQVRQFFGSLVSVYRVEIDMQPLAEAGKAVLNDRVLSSIETQPAETTLSLVPGKVEVVPGTAGQKLDYPEFEDRLYEAFKNNTKEVALQLKRFDPELTVEQVEPAREQAETILADSWKITAGSQTLIVEPAEVASWLKLDVARQGSIATGLSISLNEAPIKEKLTDFAKKADTKPVNARLTSKDGAISVVKPEQNGQSLEVDATWQKLSQAMLANAVAERTVPAEVKVAQADLRADNFSQLGIKELIGKATTDFSGSPTNRAFNIKKGQEALNGGFLKDGEEYSTTGTLGPVDESTGYLPELVIKNNRTVPEAGGGLCQVSTTLFRAVLNAGLPVTDRTNHSYRVGYYERGVGPGLDATVYIPNPDFKWKNDTGNAVYIQSYIEGTKITFEIYGTKDGRVSTISAPTILEEIPVGPAIYAETDTLYKGETKQVETAHAGARTSVTYTVNRNGQEINKQVFNSYYQAWPAQYLVGTKERPS